MIKYDYKLKVFIFCFCFERPFAKGYSSMYANIYFTQITTKYTLRFYWLGQIGKDWQCK